MQVQYDLTTGAVLAFGQFPDPPAGATYGVCTVTDAEAAKLVQPGRKVVDTKGAIGVTVAGPTDAGLDARLARKATLAARTRLGGAR